MSYSVLQSAANHASAATECDVILAGTNTAHKTVFVVAGWKGSIDAVTLTCEDTLGNSYKADNSSGPIQTGSHSKMKVFTVANGRPGSSPGDCTVKVKSGSDVGDFVVAVVELDGGSTKIIGIPVTSGPRSQGTGQTTLSVNCGVQGGGDLLMLAAGYGEPNNSVHSATETGTFAGGSMTVLKTHSSSIGSVGILGEEFNGTLSGLPEGFDYLLDASPTTSAAAVGLMSVIATATSADYQAPTPVASPGSGEFSSAPSVSLSCSLPGMDIHYTLDGSTPTSGSTLYTGPITIPGPTTTLKAIAIDPTGFWTDSFVDTEVYDLFTGTIANPGNIIDGNDSTFATITCNGSTGDVLKVRVHDLGSTTSGVAGSLKVDFEVTQNDLVASSQTLPAWEVKGKIGGTETLLASGAKGAGPVARQVVALTVPIGTHVGTDLSASIAGICQIAGSTGGVVIHVHAAYLDLP